MAIALRSATRAFIPRIIRGRKAATDPTPSTPEVSFTQGGVGVRNSIRAPLMATIRNVVKRSNQAAPARMTRGPPPRTEGSR